MRVELFNYGRYRYMLCGPADLSPGERYETELDAQSRGETVCGSERKTLGVST
ncbi:MAG: hypothetical protein QOJ04_2830 [Caballeronia sp.]|jgi:hypothetical protein|nr:hypothetical protein [Caballeronia sp.]MEA3110472.1 hypothetical protein [Caballeronia sp.]